MYRGVSDLQTGCTISWERLQRKKKQTFVHVYLRRPSYCCTQGLQCLYACSTWESLGVGGDGKMADHNIPLDVCLKLSVDQRRESDNTSVVQNSAPTFMLWKIHVPNDIIGVSRSTKFNEGISHLSTCISS